MVHFHYTSYNDVSIPFWTSLIVLTMNFSDAILQKAPPKSGVVILQKSTVLKGKESWGIFLRSIMFFSNQLLEYLSSRHPPFELHPHRAVPLFDHLYRFLEIYFFVATYIDNTSDIPRRSHTNYNIKTSVFPRERKIKRRIDEKRRR